MAGTKEITFAEIYKIIREKVVLVLIIPFLAIVLSAILSYFVIKPTYTATATMYVLNKQNENMVNASDLTSGTLLIADYKELALSKRVINATAYQVGLPDLKNFTVSLSAASNTRLLKIDVEGKDPVLVANIANAIAGNLSACITEVMKVENISIVDTATPPSNPTGPNILLNIALAGAAGLIAVIGIILMTEMVNAKLRTPEDVNSNFDVSVLAKVPVIRDWKDRSDEFEHISINRVIDEYRKAPVSLRNAIKTLHANIRFSKVDREIQTVVVTSSNPNAGKTTLSTLLAIEMAEAGRKTLLINADFHKPIPTKKGKRNRWIDLAFGEVTLEETISTTLIADLFYLRAEIEPENSEEMIGSLQFANLVDQIKADFDMVIFDTPPLGMFIEAALLAADADGTIMVISSGAAKVKETKDALDQLEKAEARVLGIVLNNVKLREKEYYSHYYYQNPGKQDTGRRRTTGRPRNTENTRTRSQGRDAGRERSV